MNPNLLWRYFEAMDELWPRLSRAERAAKLAWEASDAFTRDSDWPGWYKYLGARPQGAAPQRLRSA